MAGFDCCANLQMCLLFTFNFVIWAFGLACMGVGIWALVDANFINTIESILSTGQYSVSLATVQGAAGLLLTVGIITFIIAFCGCCGAMKKSKCLLRIYIAVMILLVVLQIVAVVLAIVFQETINSISGEVFTYWVKNDVRVNSSYYQSTEQYATEIVAINQFNGQCCGVQGQGPSSYMNSQYYNDTNGKCLVPLTCCTQQAGSSWDNPKPIDVEKCCQGNGNFTYVNGCAVNFESLLMFPYLLLYVIGLCVIVFQILVTIFACTVHKAIDEYD